MPAWSTSTSSSTRGPECGVARHFCHEHPEIPTLVTRVVEARPGALVLGETPFHHGGGRQLPDRGVLRWSGGEVRVVGVDVTGQKLWHVLADPVEVSGTVEAAVDPEFRELMIQLPLAPIS